MLLALSTHLYFAFIFLDDFLFFWIRIHTIYYIFESIISMSKLILSLSPLPRTYTLSSNLSYRHAILCSSKTKTHSCDSRFSMRANVCVVYAKLYKCMGIIMIHLVFQHAKTQRKKENLQKNTNMELNKNTPKWNKQKTICLYPVSLLRALNLQRILWYFCSFHFCIFF